MLKLSTVALRAVVKKQIDVQWGGGLLPVSSRSCKTVRSNVEALLGRKMNCFEVEAMYSVIEQWVATHDEVSGAIHGPNEQILGPQGSECRKHSFQLSAELSALLGAGNVMTVSELNRRLHEVILEENLLDPVDKAYFIVTGRMATVLQNQGRFLVKQSLCEVHEHVTPILCEGACCEDED